jgi:hypothetical protein
MTEPKRTRPSVQGSAPVTTSVKLLIPSSEDRTSLLISSNTPVYLTIYPGGPSGEGITVGLHSDWIELCLCHQGDWVKRAIYGSCDISAPAFNVYWIEGFEPWQPNHLLS